MTLSNLLSALSKRNASAATLRAGSEIQICVDGNWRTQNANLTDAALDEIIAKALPLDEEANWRVPDGLANFSAQNYRIEASKNAGAVTINIKRLAKASGKPLSAQAAGELKNSAFGSSTTFAPNAPAPPTPATSPASLPKLPSTAQPSTVESAPTPVAADAAENLVEQWHYRAANDNQVGPVSWLKIRTQISLGSIGAQTLIWKVGMSEWLPLEQTELKNLLSQKENTAWLEVNGSGNKDAILPQGLEGLNWGAFFLPVFWCFFHNLYLWGSVMLGLSLLCASLATRFTPLFLLFCLVSFAASTFLAVKGNELAWRNRRWVSADEFETAQGKWARWGGYLFFALVLLVFVVEMQRQMISMMPEPSEKSIP